MLDYFKLYFPIYKKMIDQPQFDGYHKHPVDIHSITLKFEKKNKIRKCSHKINFDELTNEQKLL